MFTGLSWRKIRARSLCMMFGNNLGLANNWLWYKHHSHCRAKSKGFSPASSEVVHQAALLENRGYACVQSQLDPALVEYFHALMPKKPDSYGIEAFFPQGDDPRLAGFLYNIVENHISQLLQSYFGSWFQPYWIQLQSMYPVKKKWDIENVSFSGFHIDDNPKQLLKAFVYLNDVDKNSGALATFDYKVTNRMLRKGFLSYTHSSRVASQKMVTPELIKKDMVYLEGKAGTIAVFDNNLLHQANQPVNGPRHSIHFEFYPAERKMTLEDYTKALSYRRYTNRDYPVNPFYNEILDAKNS